MIEGLVNANYEPVITLAVQGPSGQARDIEAVVDTGYNGYLTLPAAMIAEFELPFLGPGRATLANGAVEIFNVHDATVLWDGQPRDIEADATGSVPLVGMLLLDRHNLNIEVMDGGSVVIQARE